MQLNNLSGKAWIKLSKSAWITQKLLAWSGKAPLQKDSTFLIQHKRKRNKTMNYYPLNETRLKLTELFTQKDQVVFDPCIQDGDTMIAALFAERNFIGISASEQQKINATQLVEYHRLKDKKCTLFDFENQPTALEQIKNESVDFILTEIAKFNFKSNAENNYQYHLNEIEKSIENYSLKLKPKSYFVLIVSDQRYKNQYYCCHADVIGMLKKTNLKPQGLINIIQDSQALKAFGYPSTYVPNIINQFAIVCRKNKSINQQVFT